jgi:hypothetical protein
LARAAPVANALYSGHCVSERLCALKITHHLCLPSPRTALRPVEVLGGDNDLRGLIGELLKKERPW